MDLRQLRYFLAVADERHFGKAADRIGITQPPLSARIGELERELGVRLFHRGHGEPVCLTQPGKTLLPQARDIVAAADRALRGLQRIGRGQEGTLAVAVAPQLPGSLLARALQSFRRSWPEVSVSLTELGSRAQLEQLHDGRLDVAIIRHVGHVSDGVARPLLRTELGVLIERDRPLAAQPEVRLADLRGEALLLSRRDTALVDHDDLVAHCRRSGFEPTSVHEATVPEEFAEPLSASLPDGVVALMSRPLDLDPHVAASFVWRPIEGRPLNVTTSAVTSAAGVGVAGARLVDTIVQMAACADSNLVSAPSNLVLDA